MPDPHRVVVVGGGFAGLNVVRGLDGADVDVTLLDRTNHHLFQPLLYQVAAGILPPGLIAPALRTVIKDQTNARAVLAEVDDMDLDARLVHASAPDGRPLEFRYDTLVVAAGATHSYFGRDADFAEYASGMKTIEDARFLRHHTLMAFEMAELASDPKEREEWLTFVVIGAGPTGVELVGQIAELAHEVLPRDYRSTDTHAARIILLEGMGTVLPPFEEKLQKYAHRELESKGVEIRLNTLAVDMDQASVTVKGPDGMETIRCRSRIWAAGVKASPLAAQLAQAIGTPPDRAGRVAVEPDCTLPGHPEVFAIGDMVALNKLPGVAQPAIQEGKYVADVIKARLAGAEPPGPFEYHDKGSMATIGHRAAVAHAYGRNFTGMPAFLMWAGVHNLYLIGWGNRFGTLYTWVRGMAFARNRGHRLITFRPRLDPGRMTAMPSRVDDAPPPPNGPSDGSEPSEPSESVGADAARPAERTQ